MREPVHVCVCVWIGRVCVCLYVSSLMVSTTKAPSSFLTRLVIWRRSEDGDGGAASEAVAAPKTWTTLI